MIVSNGLNEDYTAKQFCLPPETPSVCDPTSVEAYTSHGMLYPGRPLIRDTMPLNAVYKSDNVNALGTGPQAQFNYLYMYMSAACTNDRVVLSTPGRMMIVQ